MTFVRFALLLAALASASPLPAAVRHTAPPRHIADWTHVVTETPDGGVRMGNPAAKVRLVEFFSYTCPHCAAFAAEAYAPLTQTYVKTGQISFELRSALRDRLDFVAAQVARCGGPAQFFGTTEAIFAAQQDWEQKGIDWDNAHRADLMAADGKAAIHAIATNSGLEAIVGARGVTAVALDRCLGDKPVQDILQKTTNDAWNVRQIGGTPGFMINDTVRTDIHSWVDLQGAIQTALKS